MKCLIAFALCMIPCSAIAVVTNDYHVTIPMPDRQGVEARPTSIPANIEEGIAVLMKTNQDTNIQFVRRSVSAPDRVACGEVSEADATTRAFMMYLLTRTTILDDDSEQFANLWQTYCEDY